MNRSWLIMGMALLLAAACQQTEEAAMEGEAQPMAAAEGPAAGSPEWKIQNAMSAAPADVAANATILDHPPAEGAEMPQLRAGTNDWTCFPDDPATPSNDPMCLDPEWVAWAGAWKGKTQPNTKSVGIGYMLQGGEGSNTDPYATAPTPDNQWGQAGAHLMVITPDARSLEGVTTDMNSGGPWVMWKGTPYVHLMVPTGAKQN